MDINIWDAKDLDEEEVRYLKNQNFDELFNYLYHKETLNLQETDTLAILRFLGFDSDIDEDSKKDPFFQEPMNALFDRSSYFVKNAIKLFFHEPFKGGKNNTRMADKDEDEEDEDDYDTLSFYDVICTEMEILSPHYRYGYLLKQCFSRPFKKYNPLNIFNCSFLLAVGFLKQLDEESTSTPQSMLKCYVDSCGLYIRESRFKEIENLERNIKTYFTFFHSLFTKLK